MTSRIWFPNYDVMIRTEATLPWLHEQTPKRHGNVHTWLLFWPGYKTAQLLWRILAVILDSIVVSIPACHAGDRGSIPRRGDNTFRCLVNVKSNDKRALCIELAEAHFTWLIIWLGWKDCRPPRRRCRNPGLNQGPLDLQSNALPTELFRPTIYLVLRYGQTPAWHII